jgi:hypothetical protein
VRPLSIPIELRVVLEVDDQALLHELSELLGVAEDEALRIALRGHLRQRQRAAEVQSELAAHMLGSALPAADSD